ncbi:MAG: hypothetical protein NT076_01815 [Candidatus Pacearchaeota archaeon]|nr:hypothetical protein [Candidatus Pacearchaeota archaeon]
MEIKKILHYPRLDSVLMVERFLFEHSGEYTKKQVWDRLPRKMMYQTFSVIIDYLLYSGKIASDVEGKLGWIYDPEGVKKYLAQSHLAWRKQK